jgi:hypothetical protein
MSGSGGVLGSSFHSQSSSIGGPPTLQPLSQLHSLTNPASLVQPTSTSQRQYDEGQIELMSTDMSFSALFMHDLRTRRARGYNYENLDDIRARSLWQRHDTPQATPSSGGTTPMPDIAEQPTEEDDGSKADSSHAH